MKARYILMKSAPIFIVFSLFVILLGWFSRQSAAVANNKAYQKTAYLTFDDGPSSVTAEILDILKENDVSATFFVTAQYPEYLAMLQREESEGHQIAYHTYTHIFKEIYSSSENFWNDQKKLRDLVFLQTLCSSRDFRFAGGSSNTVAPSSLMQLLRKEAAEKGYRYHDWNVDSRDAVGAKSVSTILSNVLEGVKNNIRPDGTVVILMHDIPISNSRLALDSIIKELKSQGFVFSTVNKLETPVTHKLK